MAIVMKTQVPSADQAAHDRVQEAVNAGIGRRGGPPEGLMVHLGHPEGDGFVIVDVWRSEDLARAFWIDVIEPAITGAGLTAGEPEVVPAWSIARP